MPDVPPGSALHPRADIPNPPIMRIQTATGTSACLSDVLRTSSEMSRLPPITRATRTPVIRYKYKLWLRNHYSQWLLMRRSPNEVGFARPTVSRPPNDQILFSLRDIRDSRSVGNCVTVVCSPSERQSGCVGKGRSACGSGSSSELF
jgi:hypothetical protein